jgi:hypothetical protein
LLIAAPNATEPIVFAAGGYGSSNERMRISAGGNVGVGVTSPGAKMEIKVDSNAEGIRITDSNGKKMLVVKDYHSGNTDATDIRAVGTSGGTGINADGSMMVIPKTKDSNGIQDAIDYIHNNYSVGSGTGYGIVYLPEGIYTIDAQIKLYDGIQLIGAGMRATILVASGLAADAIVTDDSGIYSAGNWYAHFRIAMKNFYLLALSATNRDYKGIYLPAACECVLENLLVEGFKTGIHLRGWTNEIKGCNVFYCNTSFDLSWPDISANKDADITNATALMYSKCTPRGEKNSTISSGSYSSGRVTITTTGNHSLQNGYSLEISNCSNSTYDGSYRDVILDALLPDTKFTALPEDHTPSGVNPTSGDVKGATCNPPKSLISSGSYTSGKVTISTSINHRLQIGASVTISGCTTNSTYNGTYRDVLIDGTDNPGTKFTAIPVDCSPSGSLSNEGVATGLLVGGAFPICGHQLTSFPFTTAVVAKWKRSFQRPAL